jgi:hypothetical protein
MKTLQEQYNLIKEGKGNKEILLKTAKQLYPNVIPNHFTYNQAVPLLKQRGLLHESIGGVVTKGKDPDWFSIFKKNTHTLNEVMDYSSMSDAELIMQAKNAGLEENLVYDGEGGLANRDEIIDLLGGQDMISQYTQREKDIEQYGMGHLRHLAEAKAIEKKPTKDVVDMETKGFDYKNKENIDNIYGQAFLIGYYAEMKDPKNADKTVDDLKAIVAKNLYKDPLYYVKNGQFGTKGVGYTDEAPGLKASKTDQMIPVPDQVKPKASKIDLGDREKKTGAAKKVKGEMTVVPKSSKGVKKMPLPGKEKKIRLQENINANLIDKYADDIKDSKMSYNNAYSFLFRQGLDQDQVDIIMDYAFPKTTSEQKIRSIIFQLIKEELKEMQGFRTGYDAGKFDDGPQPSDNDMSSEMIWNSLSDDTQEELLTSYIKDFDEAIFFVGKEWDSIPDDVTANILRDKRFHGEIDLDEAEEGVVELPKGTSPSDIQRYTGSGLNVTLKKENEDLDYNPEMFGDVFYQQIEDLENELTDDTIDPERKKELQRKIDTLMKGLM